jgi:hypothetical protein
VNVADLKSENSDVLTTADMVDNSMQAIDKRINKDGETFVDRRGLMPATDVVPPQINTNILANQQLQQQIYFRDNNNIRNVLNDVDEQKSSIDGWINFSTKVESTIDESNANVTWEQLNNEGITPSTTRLPLYYPVPMIDVGMRPPEEQPPDVFPNFDNVASNDFDLLSYLCEVSRWLLKALTFIIDYK